MTGSQPERVLRYTAYYFADQPSAEPPHLSEIIRLCRQRPVVSVILGYLLAYPDDSLSFEPAEAYDPYYDEIISSMLDYCAARAELYGSLVKAAYHRQGGMGNLAYSNPRWEIYNDPTAYFNSSPA